MFVVSSTYNTLSGPKGTWVCPKFPQELYLTPPLKYQQSLTIYCICGIEKINRGEKCLNVWPLWAFL